MTRQVFISHSATDREAAEAIRAALEAAGAPCWIAPRDIPPGAEWADAIMAGIAEASLVLLIHSAASAASQMVRREVNVAVDGRTVVFVEVKTRHSTDAGHPADAVDADKQRRLTRLALAYLKRHDLLEHSARFDVLAVTWPDSRRKPTIDHYKNAFEAVGRGQMFS